MCSLAIPLFYVFRVPPPALWFPWLLPYSMCPGFHHISSVFLGYIPIFCVQGSTTCPLCSFTTPSFSLLQYNPILCVQGSITCPLRSSCYTPVLSSDCMFTGSNTCPKCSLATPFGYSMSSELHHRYRDILYTNILYTWQSLYELSLYGTEFIRDKVYTGQSLYRTKFIRGQSLYGAKVNTGQSSYSDKVYTRTKFI